MMHSHVMLQGHEPCLHNAERIEPVDANEQIQVSIYLKPRSEPGAPDPSLSLHQLRSALHVRRAAEHQGDIGKLEEFAARHGLMVVSAEPAQRLVKLSGTAAQTEDAFQTKLAYYRAGAEQFRAHEAPIHLPRELEQIAQAVLGLETRSIAGPRMSPAPAVSTRWPNQIPQLYQLLSSRAATGTGQCIGIIAFGDYRWGSGYFPEDIASAFSQMKLRQQPELVDVTVDGFTNRPPAPPRAADDNDKEVTADIQIAGAVAPGAKLAVYFAPNTLAGWPNAISSAVHDSANNPSVISISFGFDEEMFSTAAVAAIESKLQEAVSAGICVLVSAANTLSTLKNVDGKVHVQYPASSPSVIGCGGTQILGSGNEVVWNSGVAGTGGGISRVYPIPSFQANANLPTNIDTKGTGRGVPDVAGNAGPYNIVFQGQTTALTGTSAVAPLWAGLLALVNERALRRITFDQLTKALYGGAPVTRGITSGNNTPSAAGAKGYSAGAGWNACAGVGVPFGPALFEKFLPTVQAVATGGSDYRIVAHSDMYPSKGVWICDGTQWTDLGRPQGAALFGLVGCCGSSSDFTSYVYTIDDPASMAQTLWESSWNGQTWSGWTKKGSPAPDSRPIGVVDYGDPFQNLRFAYFNTTQIQQFLTNGTWAYLGTPPGLTMDASTPSAVLPRYAVTPWPSVLVAGSKDNQQELWAYLDDGTTRGWQAVGTIQSKDPVEGLGRCWNLVGKPRDVAVAYVFLTLYNQQSGMHRLWLCLPNAGRSVVDLGNPTGRPLDVSADSA